MLRILRQQGDLTIEQVAEKVELSASTISRIENAHVDARTRDVRELLEVYDVDEEQRAQVLELARHPQQPWWFEYRAVPIAPLVDLEEAAASILQFSVLLVPDLLQTRDYAEAVIRAIFPDRRREELERLLELGMRGQELLARPDPPTLWAIIDEATLIRPVGGLAVMREQLQRLIEESALPNVTLQVLPFTAGDHAGMYGAFTMFRYPDPAEPDVVVIEHSGGNLFLKDRRSTDRYSVIFDHLRARALSPMDSIRLLANMQSEAVKLT